MSSYIRSIAVATLFGIAPAEAATVLSNAVYDGIASISYTPGVYPTITNPVQQRTSVMGPGTTSVKYTDPSTTESTNTVSTLR